MTPLDRLSPLLDRFRVQAHLFHAGPLCGVTRFDAAPGRGFLHVMQRGEMLIRHRRGNGLPTQVRVTEPSLVFYPRPLAHDFHNAPEEGSDFICATLDFEAGDTHPLVQALPPLMLLPLHQVPGLAGTLELLFAEGERVRCGQKLLASRLFEVLLLQLLRWLLDQPGETSQLPLGLLRGLADPRLARALTAMHERPGEAWTLERLAHEAGQSRSHFAERFKSAVGQPPADYLAQWRLSLARAALREGKPVKQIAAELGYANASALTRRFTQVVGMTPREWMRRSGG